MAASEPADPMPIRYDIDEGSVDTIRIDRPLAVYALAQRTRLIPSTEMAATAVITMAVGNTNT